MNWGKMEEKNQGQEWDLGEIRASSIRIPNLLEIIRFKYHSRRFEGNGTRG